MSGLLSLSSGGIKLPSFLDRKVASQNSDATISNRMYDTHSSVKRSRVNHSNDAYIVKYNPLQDC
jgi:hypothetical protein